MTRIYRETMSEAQRGAAAWREGVPSSGAVASGGAVAREVQLVRRGDAGFPLLLREIPAPPERLHLRGCLLDEDALAVAVVGSRQATPYGIAVAERLAFDLAARGVTVVSGLARGIDSAAHRGALEAGGRTIAVLGSGLDVIYPPENRRLAARIAAQGAVVSQYAMDARALPQHFPERNRVIAGLSLGVVVVEAAEKSGSLITARHALELGREVMAVPGRITSPTSRGAHRLLKDGAAPVEGWEDVVAQLPRRFRDCVSATALPGPRADGCMQAGDDERRLLALLGEEPVGIDELIARSGLGAGRTAALLQALALDGVARQLPGARFVRAGRA
ncbi:MAG: DNA-protecting protein DprA [Candidatus Rokubacteria bacterium]|nr:DNA-protecting protein DprA [Candidatus Rokubacteria bacterium]